MSGNVVSVVELYQEWYTGIDVDISAGSTHQRVRKPAIKAMMDAPDDYPAWKQWRKSTVGKQHICRRKAIIDAVDARYNDVRSRGKTALEVAVAFDAVRGGRGLTSFNTLIKKEGLAAVLVP